MYRDNHRNGTAFQAKKGKIELEAVQYKDYIGAIDS